MILAVFLFVRRRKKLILGIVVDHVLGENLFIRAYVVPAELLIHEIRKLFHIHLDIRNIIRSDKVEFYHLSDIFFEIL